MYNPGEGASSHPLTLFAVAFKFAAIRTKAIIQLTSMSITRLRRRFRQEREQAFTFTELIIVLLVATLLAVVMLPALARSGDNGGRSTCINNLRQMGRAVAMYANDNADYLPYPNWGTPSMPNGQPGRGWLFTPVGPNPPNLSVPPYLTNPLLAYTNGLLYQYVRNMNAYRCPVDSESRYYPNRANKLSSYVMNGAVCGYSMLAIYRSCKITEIWNPECYLMWNPSESVTISGTPIGYFAYNDASAYPDNNEGVATLHTLSGADIVTVSGNVRFVTMQKIEMEKTNTTKNLIWWSPFSANGR